MKDPTTSPEIEGLLRRAADGDESAVEALFGEYRSRLKRMIQAHMNRELAARLEASDVVQDSLLTASQRLPAYLRDRPLPFYAWLRRMASERLVQLQRQHVHSDRRSVRREQQAILKDASTDALADHFATQQPGPLTTLLREEARQRIRDALQQLESVDQEVMVMRHLERLSTPEIAAVLEISTSTAKRRYLSGVAQLRELLNEQ